jgi:hypothetical protein
MKTFYVKIVCNVSKQVFNIPVLARTLTEAQTKVMTYPYNDSLGYNYSLINGCMMEFKIVGYLLTYRYPEYSGLTHLDRFDTLAKAEEYAETSELTEYVINPIVDLSGD